MAAFVGWRRSGELWVRENGALSASGNGRYFVGGFGVPVFLFGQAAWGLTQNLTQAEVITFLDDQASRGVNLLLVDPIMRYWTLDGGATMTNVAGGVTPFTGTTGGQEDLSTPREAFWAHVDWVIDQAAARGIIMLLTPTYVGNADAEGIYVEIGTNSQAQVEAYATFLGNRYKSRSNIMWVVGGDRAWANLSATVQARLEQFAAALQTADPSHIVSAHFLNSDLNWEHTSGQWLDWTFNYSASGAVVQDCLDGYAYNGPIPLLLGENTYVDSPWDGSTANQDKKQRGQYWQATLTGAIAGFIFGDENVWPFGGQHGYAGTDWEAALNSTYMQQAQLAAAFFRARRFDLLVPDTGSTLVTAGRGSIGASYVTAAKASDGSWAAAYIPGGGQITVNCNQLSGAVTATWYDPSNGSTSSAGSGLTGSQNFDPGPNAAGDTDMVLLLTVP